MTKKSRLSAAERVKRAWRKPIEKPRQPAPGPPEDALIIGKDPVAGYPIFYERDDLSVHLHVAGGSHAGKSNFLRVLLDQLLRRKRITGEGFALIDPHGNLATYARDLIASKYPEFADELYYMDLSQEQKVLGFNPLSRGQKHPYFAAQCVTEAVLKAFGAQGTQEFPSVTTVLCNILEALIHGGLPFTAARHFLQRSDLDLAIVRGVVDAFPAVGRTADVKSFWEGLEKKSEATIDAKILGPLNRLSPLIKPLALKRMLSAPDVTLDFKELMDQGGIGIFNLAREGAGITVDGQHMFAALLVQEFRQVFEERTPDRSKPFTLIMDEFGDYVPADFARVLTAARKFNLRCVFAHQNLSQLVDKDQDRTLLETVLAVPNKVIFGGLPLGDAKVLAEEMFLAAIDPDKIKFFVKNLHFDPRPTKVILRASARGGAKAKTITKGKSSSTDRSTSSGGSYDPETDRTIVTSSVTEREGETASVQRAFMSQYNWTDSEHEAFVTLYNERVQEGPHVYRPLEEQIFEYAKQLKMSPRGQAVMTRYGAPPSSVLVPWRPDIGFSMGDIEAFLEKVYDKPIYLDPDELDQLIEEREQKLLATAEPRIKSSSGGKERVKASRKRKNDR